MRSALLGGGPASWAADGDIAPVPQHARTTGLRVDELMLGVHDRMSRLAALVVERGGHRFADETCEAVQTTSKLAIIMSSCSRSGC